MPANRLLTTIRESRGVTQGALADLSGIAPSRISRFEAGALEMTDEERSKICGALRYRESILDVDRTPRFSSLSLWYHRGLKSAPVKKTTRLHAMCAIRELQIRELMRIDMPSPDIDLREIAGRDWSGRSIESVSWFLRGAMGVPAGPIDDLMGRIESMGAIIVHFDFELPQIDALCRMTGDTPPIFFVNLSRPACRTRFSLAHEIAHVLLHWKEQVPPEVADPQANEFAAELLMPAGEAKLEISSRMSLADAARIKERWGISMRCAIEIAKSIGKIDRNRHRWLLIELARIGGTRVEPIQIPREVPRAFASLVERWRKQADMSTDELSQLLHVYPTEIADWLSPPPVADEVDGGTMLRLTD